MRKSPERPYGALSALYDRFMDDIDYDAWCGYYLNITGLGRRARLLEAACGTGLMTRRLLKGGLSVTACDSSPEMLAAAADNLRKHGQSCPLIHMDMRKLSIHRPQDGVIACCDALNYLTSDGDMRAFFEAAHSCLAPGGVFAFDISGQDKLLSMDGQVFYDDRDDETCVWTGEFDNKSGILALDVVIFSRESGGNRYIRYDERHMLRAYKTDDIISCLYKSGFVDINTYSGGSAQGESYMRGRVHFTAKRGN